ncbi:unnamed protein product [Gulo gulo]|uniref:Uncharacterized protein n=1 Tax=Gulo gulo TaxID=48420 RepID=A0A9X9Q0D9_GULGU|nr:unnamed protein product [Gulo gulo]
MLRFHVVSSALLVGRTSGRNLSQENICLCPHQHLPECSGLDQNDIRESTVLTPESHAECVVQFFCFVLFSLF